MCTISFLYGNPNWVGKAIQLWTCNWRDKFNGNWKKVPYHVEISFGGNRWYSASLRSGTWRMKRFVPKSTYWRRYALPTLASEDEVMEQQAIKYEGTKYDWLNIFASDIAKLDMQDNSRLTCDEGVANVLSYSHFGYELKKHIGNLNPKRLEEAIKKGLKNVS